MSLSNLKKQYGLITKSGDGDKLKTKPAAIFNDEDDDQQPTTARESASTIRRQRQAERIHEMAQAEDPTIFDYDGSYDEIQAIKNEKKEDQKRADKLREPKYAEAIIKANIKRKLETHSREERQQQKERVKEGGMFADKEVFVTDAYRKQMEEVQQYREEEAVETRLNDLTSVDKQKMWQMGMNRNLLNDIARCGETITQKKKKERHLRERLTSSPSPTRDKEGHSENDEKPKKSIYSDDEEEEKKKKSLPVAKEKKNFEGELKPGLNRVTKKAPTKAERLRERNFTPTPPGSDDEGALVVRSTNGRIRSTSTDVKQEVEENEKPAARRESRKMSNKLKLKPKVIDKAERLEGLKKILKQRNTEADIEEFRQRYLERRSTGFVQPPL